MISAKAAKQALARAKVARQRSVNRLARAKAKAQETEDARILREDVPRERRRLNEAIKKAIKECDDTLSFDVSSDTVGYALRDALVKKGFVVSAVKDCEEDWGEGVRILRTWIEITIK